MKLITVQVMVFEEGDLVKTDQGVGKVIRFRSFYKELGPNEPPGHGNRYFFSEVVVQHKHGCVLNPSNAPSQMKSYQVFPISEKEYKDNF